MSERKGGLLKKQILEKAFVDMGIIEIPEKLLDEILAEAAQELPWLGRKHYIEEGWSSRDDEDDCYLILQWFKKWFGEAEKK